MTSRDKSKNWHWLGFVGFICYLGCTCRFRSRRPTKVASKNKRDSLSMYLVHISNETFSVGWLIPRRAMPLPRTTPCIYMGVSLLRSYACPVGTQGLDSTALAADDLCQLHFRSHQFCCCWSSPVRAASRCIWKSIKYPGNPTPQGNTWYINALVVVRSVISLRTLNFEYNVCEQVTHRSHRRPSTLL